MDSHQLLLQLGRVEKRWSYCFHIVIWENNVLLLIKISPLPKYRALYLKVRIHQLSPPFEFCSLAPFKGLYTNIELIYPLASL